MIQLSKHTIIIILGSILGVSSIALGLFYIINKQDNTPVTTDVQINSDDTPIVQTSEELIDTTSGYELFPNDTSLDGITNEEKVSLGLDPTEYDTDKDGLSDALELEIKTDPLTADSDSDGLSDGQEVLVYESNPLVEDTDSDGFSDAEEINAGFSPLCAGNVLLFASCLEN